MTNQSYAMEPQNVPKVWLKEEQEQEQEQKVKEERKVNRFSRAQVILASRRIYKVRDKEAWYVEKQQRKVLSSNRLVMRM